MKPILVLLTLSGCAAPGLPACQAWPNDCGGSNVVSNPGPDVLAPVHRPDDSVADNGGVADPEGPRMNASANNGKGGNYDRTGHSDNGKGRGRDRK